MIRFLSAWMFVVSTLALGNDDISISLDVDRTSASMEDQLSLRVTIDGTRKAPQPNFPQSDAYEIVHAGSSSQIQIINGSMNTQNIHSFQISFTRSGKIQVGPATVEIDGKTYQSQTLTLQIVKAGAKKPQDTHYFLDAKASINNPFVHQQVIYTFRFYNRAQIANADLKLPDFAGFWKEDLGKQKEFRETVNGIQWQVTEIQFALFPESAGAKEIGPAQLTLDALVRTQGRRRGFSIFDDSFFGSRRTKRSRLRSDPLTFTVQPLPDPPQGFPETNLVGQFNARSELNKTQAKVGESLTLTVTIEGSGNAWDAKVPSWEGPNIKVYADKPEVQKSIQSGSLWSKKTFRFAVVPQADGAIEIPSVAFSFFNPELGTYERSTTQPTTVQVQPSDETESLNHFSATEHGERKRSVEVLGSDLMPLKVVSDISSDSLTRKEWIGLMASLGGCPLVYAFAFGWQTRRRRISADSGYERREKAYGRFKASLGRLSDESTFYQDASLTMREFLGDRIGIEGRALTPKDARRVLEDRGIDAECIDSIESLLEAFELGQYGGAKSSTVEQQDLVDRMSRIAKSILKSTKS